MPGVWLAWALPWGQDGDTRAPSAPRGVGPGVAAQPHSAHARAQERGQATSRLTARWGNGNFPLMLAAAPDLKTTNPASPGRSARAGVQMRYDSPRHTRMATSCPAATAARAGRRCPAAGTAGRREARAGPRCSAPRAGPAPPPPRPRRGHPSTGPWHHSSLMESSAVPGGLAAGCPVPGGLAISVPFR